MTECPGAIAKLHWGQTYCELSNKSNRFKHPESAEKLRLFDTLQFFGLILD
jgi:hypothetical protein